MIGRADAADRRPPDPRHRRRRAGRASGTSCATPAGRGLATLLISADLDELIGLSDTLLVMLRRARGRRARPGEGHARRARAAYMTGAASPRAGRRARSCRPSTASPRLLVRRSAPPLIALVVTLLVTSHRARCISREPTRSTPSATCSSYGTTAATASIVDHQPGTPLLHRRRGRGHRVQDEPVQHRRRGPVPPRRADRRRRPARRSRSPRRSTCCSSSSWPWSSAPRGPASPACSRSTAASTR